jgi:hypothetical protein
VQKQENVSPSERGSLIVSRAPATRRLLDKANWRAESLNDLRRTVSAAPIDDQNFTVGRLVQERLDRRTDDRLLIPGWDNRRDHRRLISAA